MVSRNWSISHCEFLELAHSWHGFINCTSCLTATQGAPEILEGFEMKDWRESVLEAVLKVMNEKGTVLVGLRFLPKKAKLDLQQSKYWCNWWRSVLSLICFYQSAAACRLPHKAHCRYQKLHQASKPRLSQRNALPWADIHLLLKWNMQSAKLRLFFSYRVPMRRRAL